jgi:hypothetical protein
MKKTALQEAFNLLEELHPSFFDVHTEKGRAFIQTFHKFIDIEKQQIIEAYNEGQNTPYEYSESNDVNWYDGNNYYKETYNL